MQMNIHSATAPYMMTYKAMRIKFVATETPRLHFDLLILTIMFSVSATHKVSNL